MYMLSHRYLYSTVKFCVHCAFNDIVASKFLGFGNYAKLIKNICRCHRLAILLKQGKNISGGCYYSLALHTNLGFITAFRQTCDILHPTITVNYLGRRYFGQSELNEPIFAIIVEVTDVTSHGHYSINQRHLSAC